MNDNNRVLKRILTLVLSLAMIFAYMPASMVAYAAGEGSGAEAGQILEESIGTETGASGETAQVSDNAEVTDTSDESSSDVSEEDQSTDVGKTDDEDSDVTPEIDMNAEEAAETDTVESDTVQTDAEPYVFTEEVQKDGQYVIAYEDDGHYHVVTNEGGKVAVQTLDELTTATVSDSMLWTTSAKGAFAISSEADSSEQYLYANSKGVSLTDKYTYGWDYNGEYVIFTDWEDSSWLITADDDVSAYSGDTAKAQGKAVFYARESEIVSKAKVRALKSAAKAAGDSSTHYLAVASDRHSTSTAIGSAMSGMPSTVEYVSLNGDMVDGTSSYYTNTILSEVQEVFPNLTSSNVSIVYGSHDQNATDSAGIMKCKSSSGLIYTGYESDGTTVAYYVYGISYSSMTSDSTSDPAAFKTWVDTVEDKSIPIIVICHVPLHYSRNDNGGAVAWNKALNYAATGEETTSSGKEVVRDVVFLHGHNHTTEGNSEYYIPRGSTMQIYNSSNSSHIYYTYTTAGYLRDNTAATLIGIDDSNITISKYKNGSVSSTYKSSGYKSNFSDTYDTAATHTIARVVQEDSGDLDVEDVEVNADESGAVASHQIDYTCKVNGTEVTPTTISYEVKTDTSVIIKDISDDGLITFNAGKYGTATVTANWTYNPNAKSSASLMKSVTPDENGVYSGSTDFKVTVNAYAEQHTVTFNTNGGSDVATQTVNDGETATKPADPTKSGYTFSGWYLNGREYDFTTLVTSDITLTAKWSKVTEETVYVLTDTLEAGKNYLIVNANAGSGYAVSHETTTVSADEVTIKDGTVATNNKAYIESSDVNAASVWTSASGIILTNDGYTLYVSGNNSSNLSISTSPGSQARTNWTYSSNKISAKRSSSGGGGSNTSYYAYYSDGWIASSSSSTAGNVYLYEETKIQSGSEVEYEFTADDISVMANEDGTVDNKTISYKLTADGVETTPESIAFAVEEGSDNIIVSISDSGEITFTGTAGTAMVNIVYTYVNEDKEQVSETVQINVTVREYKDHTWSTSPVWTWIGSDADGYTAATATFVCTDEGCDETFVADAEVTSETNTPDCQTPKKTTYTATATGPDGETYSDKKIVGSDKSIEAYVLVDEFILGKDYLILDSNTAGSAHALLNSSGSVSSSDVTILSPDDEIDTVYVLADVNVASGAVWNATAHPNSSYAQYPRLINDGYAVYPSRSALSLSNSLTDTSGAVYTRYWTYEGDGKLAAPSTNSSSSKYYAVYSSGFGVSTSGSGIFIYEKQTVAAAEYGDHDYQFKDITWNDGYASAYATYECSVCGTTATVAAAVNTEDREATCDKPERTSYIATVSASDSLDGEEHVDDDTYYVAKQIPETTTVDDATVYVLTTSVTTGKNYLVVSSSEAGTAHAVSNSSSNTSTSSNLAVSDASVTVLSGEVNGSTQTYIETVDSYAVWTAGTDNSSTTFENGSYYLYHDGGKVYVNTSTSKNNWTLDTNILKYTGGSTTYYLTYSDGWTLSESSANVYLYEELTGATIETTTYSDAQPLGHNLSKVEAKDATCEEAGNSEYWSCSRCDKIFSDEAGTTETTLDAVTIAAIGHDYGEPSWKWSENYTSATATFICANDDSHKKILTDNAPSNKVNDDGSTTYTATVTLDGKSYTDSKTTDPSHVHAYGDPEYTWSADNSKCTATMICGSCDETTEGHTVTEEVTSTSEVTKAATCETKGEKTYTATFTNTAFATQTKTEEIAALGHNYELTGWTWGENNSSATVTFTCKNDSTHVETVNATVTSATTSASCEEAGKTEYTALATFEGKDYTDTKEVVIPAIGHNWGAATYTWAEDNSSVTATRTCTNDASHVETETVAATYKVTTAATCTETGIGTWTATFEGDKFGNQTKTVEIAALGHTLTATAAKAATCEEAGYSAYWTCSVCGKHFSDAEGTTEIEEDSWVIDATGHDWDNGTVTTPATCTEAGVKTYTCKNDSSHTKTETIAATGHNWGAATYTWADDNSSVTATRTCANDARHVETETVATTNEVTTAATCETPGVRTYTSAAFKNTAFAAQTKTEEIPAIGHNWGAATYTWADDNSSVTATRTCTNDSKHIETETVKTTSKVNKEADCTTKGETTYTATFTNTAFETKTKATEIAALGHAWGEWTETKAATEAEEGEETRTCSRCGETETRTIPKLSHVHKLTLVEAKAATCTEAGNVKYWVCSEGDYPCGRYFADENGSTELDSEDIVIPATGHTYELTEWTWSDDNSSATATFTCKNDSSHTLDVEADVTYETTDSTCDALGKTVYTAVAELDGDSYSFVKEIIIPKKAHDWNEPEYTWAYDNSTVLATRTCKNFASHTEDETVNTTSEVTKKATCDEDGERTYTAEFSNSAFETQIRIEVIPAKGHSLTATPARAATCEEAGNSAYWTCSECGKYFSDSEGKHEITKDSWVIDATGHEWGTATYTWAEDNSTVTATRTCANDPGHAETETVEATYAVTTPVTETTAGEGVWTSEEFKNEAFEAQTKEVTIPPTGYKATYEWTKTTDGWSVTGTAVPYDTSAQTITETVDATYEVTTEATCTAAGEGTWTATFENNKFGTQIKTEEIPATGHDWDDGEVTTPATCTEAGVKTYTCKNDSTHKKTEAIPAHGHDLKLTPAKAATATTAGNTAYYTCSVCGKYFSDASGTKEIAKNSWIIPAKGETPVAPAVTSFDTTIKGTTTCIMIWTGNSSAKNYRVAYKVTGGSYKYINVGSATTYTVRGLTAGKTYVFTVAAQDAAGKWSRYYYNTWSYRFTGITNPKATAKKGKTTVTWAKVTGATGYDVRYGYSGGKMYTKSTVATSKTFSTGAKGKTVVYQVRPFKTVSGKKYLGAWSDQKSIKAR